LLVKVTFLYTSHVKILLSVYYIVVWTFFLHTLETYEVLLIYSVFEVAVQPPLSHRAALQIAPHNLLCSGTSS
jgi:hypothetical protein